MCKNVINLLIKLAWSPLQKSRVRREEVRAIDLIYQIRLVSLICHSEQEVAVIVANGMDSMASAHWWTCLVMFSLFLNRPLPSSVPLTMPGSSRDPHLPLCFPSPCFPLFFPSLIFCKEIHNWSKQIKTQHKLCKCFASNSHFQRIYKQVGSCCWIFITFNIFTVNCMNWNLRVYF